MPWRIQKQDGRFCVIKESDNSIEKCHGSRADALAHMRALYASEGKSMDNDAMIYFGGEVKALNDSGLVGGYLVRFSDANRKDLTGEFFTNKTYLGPSEGNGAESLFDHGYPIPVPNNVDPTTKSRLLALADHTFAPLKTKRDAMGIWAEVVLNLADEYEKRVYQMAKQNKLGWSSGAPGHRVKKAGNGEILSWPIAEGSLTPTPAEPLNRAISMKSLGSVKFVPLDDPFDDEDETPLDVKAEWSTAFQNNLPDSSFAYIEPGGSKDSDGKTTPRSLRHFPYKDASGKPDAAHVRNALARIPQSNVSAAAQGSALRKVRAAAKQLGIDVADGKSLAGRLNQFIEDSVDEGRTREDMVKMLARECLLSVENIEALLAGTFRPRTADLKAISRTLGLPFETLKMMADRNVPKTIKGIFEDALAEETQEGPCGYMLWGILSGVVSDVATMTSAAKTTGTEFDMAAKITEAVDEYASRLKASIVAQITDWANGDDEMEEYDPDAFHLKSLIRLNPESWRLVTKGLAMDEHLQLVGTAEEDYLARLDANADRPRGKSHKAGRELSDKNRQRLMKLQQMHKEHADAVGMHIQKLLDDTKPMASDMQKRAAQLNHLRVKQAIRQIGGLNG